MSAPWDAWRDLASRPWDHILDLPGAALVSEVSALEERTAGDYVWARETLHRTPAGGFVFVRASRGASGPDALVVVAAGGAESLVAELKARVGLPPGRIELLGRGGIEVGLAPDDEVEGDELEGPGP